MSENKEKQIRIYKFATDNNIVPQSIFDFLQKKGYEVKTIQSKMTDDMYNDVSAHFKKEIEKAHQHYKKVQDFNKKLEEGKRPAENLNKVEASALPVEKMQNVEESAEVKETTPKVEVEIKQEIVQVNVEEKQESTDVKIEKPVITEVVAAKPAEQKNNKESYNFVPEKRHVDSRNVKVEANTNNERGNQKKVSDSHEYSARYSQKQGSSSDDADKHSGSHNNKGKVVKFITQSERDLQKRSQQGLRVVGFVDLDKNKKNFARDNQFKKDAGSTNVDSSQLPEKKKENRKVVDYKSAITQPKDTNVEDESFKKKKKKNKNKKNTTTVAEDEAAALAKKKKKGKKFVIDVKDVDEAIRRTMSTMEDTSISDRAVFKKKKKKEKQLIEIQKEEERRLEEYIIKVTEFMSVSELAARMNVSVSDIISKCMGLGMMVSINQRLDLEAITYVADEFGYKVEEETEYEDDSLQDYEDDEDELGYRPPIVTVMGHVDHGKTTLLDYIRSANVVAGEAGGITQHIGAYRVILPSGKSITFLDTPGHEAFTAMRARGAKLTDLVILVVAADDSVMPQTIEAINHAQAAGVPMIVAINKVDKPGVDIDKIKRQLADHNVLVEDWGGKYQCVEVSAKKGLNVDNLLEKVILEADLMDLKANSDREARGAVVEAELDKGRGIVATVLVQKGTLRVGDPYVVGVQYGRVRAMFDERGNKLEEAGPSCPVLVLGFEGMPQAGDTFVVVDSEKDARNISLKRQQLKREQDLRKVQKFGLDEFARQIQSGNVKNLPIIVKGDVDGSIEALADSLMKLSTDDVRVNVIHKAVGGITEGDVLLAAASKAVIIGFHVRPNIAARKLAENENIDIRLYNVIYDAINEVRSALEGLLAPIISEEVTATIEVREVYKIPKVGTVLGCYVQEGKVKRSHKVTIIREGIEIFRGEISTLKRFKDDVREVDAGYECGISIQGYNDLKVGDVLETYVLTESKQTLD